MALIKFTEQALKDLDDIAEYISLDSHYYASLQIQKLLFRIERLERFPNIGRVVPELNLKSVREIIEGNYRIIYKKVNKKETHIITIHHSGRSLRKASLQKLIRKSK